MEQKHALLLLVEDEIVLQDELAKPLRDAGFTVLTQIKGAAAIKTLEERSSEINALITDVTLADAVTGWEVAHKAREINPQLPVIYTTGHDAEVWAANGVPNSVHITKPLLPVQVLTALAQLLNTSSTP